MPEAAAGNTEEEYVEGNSLQELEVEEGLDKEDDTKMDFDEPKEDKAADTAESKTEDSAKVEEIEEYYVKYRNFSYLHCEWRTEEELLKGDRRIPAKLKRFKQKQASQTNIFENLEEEPFNPDYVEVERVLDVAEQTDPNNGQTVKHYLVKWRALQYEDSTWELQDDVDPAKIKQFEIFSKLPPKDQWKPKKKPVAKEWEKLDESPVYKNDNTLRAYQLEGLNWLLFSWYNGRNCILADEMGLGKTIQSLTFIHAVHEYGIRGPFLVIAPLSTIPNWQREFEAWTDLNVIVYHGSAASRNMLQEYEMYFRNEKGNVMKDLPKFNVLITTFEIIITDFQDLKDFSWRICVIDEAHRLKNRNCKLLEGLRSLTLEHRVLLSGTPLQNNVNELFSLLNFLEPQQFASSDAFLNEFGALKSEQEVQKLQIILKPMMLRRLKEDVEKSLAPKEETVVEVELTNIQKKYYRGILEKNFSFLSKGTTSANVPNLMNTMMELRKCCIHPYLLNGAEDQIQHDYRQQHGEDTDSYYKALISSSGKMVLIDKLLPKLKSSGHRVLIFSQMVRCLDILEDYLMFRKYPFERIDGRIRGNLRQAAIDRFCKPDSDRFVFLLCTKAGGLGINLTAADTVIIYDSDWNPQNDLQAQARCHRIGQQKMVKVYRLLCRNTYEREMFDKASLKLGLDKAVLQSMNTSQGGKEISNNKQLTKKEIEDLLKKGAYGAIMDEDNAADKFCEEDIDQILERRTQIITLESEKGSTFSKASFASSGIRSDIDIDDPDFWKKWAKKADIDTSERDEQSELLMHEPRRRTQIKRYGHDEAVMDMSDLESSSGGETDNDNDTALGVGRGRGRRVKNKLHKKHKFRFDEYTNKDGEITYGAWARSECFKVERGLLTFGWGRWQEILSHNQFREGWKECDIEDCARVIVLYCLRFYRGDDKIRTFIWDLITPPEFDSRNHTVIPGSTQGIPRGRKATRKLKHCEGMDFSDHWSRHEKFDGDIFLESNYRKHLSRHANKLLLRVRMLHYIKNEIIGDLVQHISDGTHISSEDKEMKLSDEDDVASESAGGLGTSDDISQADPTDEPGASSTQTQSTGPAGEDPAEPGKPQWPSMVDLNHRLRRVINSYQRNFKKEEMKMAQKAKTGIGSDGQTSVDISSLMAARGWDWHQLAMYLWKVERREKYEQLVKERERQKMEVGQRKWTRREEQDFFRTISTYGVEYDRQKKKYVWDKFRTLSKLDKKFDDTLTEYYLAFSSMCKRVCGIKPSPEEVVVAECSDMMVEPISEDRARRILDRIGLLSKIREETLCHPQLEQRLALCLPSADVPEWWIPGKHDKDLLVGAAKHGLGRTDVFILNDPELSFHEVARKNVMNLKGEANIKLEKPEDILPLDKNEIVVKLDKGEGTLKIEKVGVKVELDSPEAEVPIPIKEVKEQAIDVDMEKDEKPLTVGVSDKEKEVEKESEMETEKTEELPKEGEPKIDDEVKGAPVEETKMEVEEPITESTIPDENVTETEHKDTPELEKEVADQKEVEEKPEDETAGAVEVVEEEKAVLEEEVTEKDTIIVPEDDENKNKVEVKKTVEEEPVKEGCTVAKPESDDSPKAEESNKEEKTDTVEEPKSVECKTEAVVTGEKNKGDEKEIEGIERFKAMFPELEVMQKLPEIDTTVVTEKAAVTVPRPSLDSTVAQLIAHSYQNPIKWPKEHALQVRLQHIVHVVEHKEWPASRNFTAYADEQPTTMEEYMRSSYNEPSEVITITTDHGPKANTFAQKRKRHIAIDVETERAKLHALLNSTNLQLQHAMKHSPSTPWDHTDESLSEESRRSTPLAGVQNLQPPPAHQGSSTATTSRLLSMPPYDLKYHPAPAAQPDKSVTPVPASSPSSMAPIDLSSGSLKSSNTDNNSSSNYLEEVQDFSMPSKKLHLQHHQPPPPPPPQIAHHQPQPQQAHQHPAPQQAHQQSQPQQAHQQPPTMQSRGKLDDMLNKLMQKKNCPVPVDEPVVGKEKKKRKLDEIVLGLSAAKEQSVSEKKPMVSPSVTVTLSNKGPPPRSSLPPSSGTPSPSASKQPDTSSYLAEQHSLLLKQQQQLQQQILQQQQALKMSQPSSAAAAQVQRKTYEAMIADISKVADFSAKISSYSHEAKVNKWLAEQSGVMPEQPLSADFLSPRRRRPRVDPTLLDWKKLTGEENVSVINRLTGKKLTGSKAPQLKRLAQWLLENPMFDVDPKWAELVKERGNLPHDLQKRLPPGDRKKGPGRPPLLSSPPGTSTPVSQSSNMQFPSLGGINPSSLLSGLSMGGFDPKNNPLLLPFGGLPNMGALSGMSGLGNMNLTNSIFANLAGLGLPGLAGMDPAAVSSAMSAMSDSTTSVTNAGASTSKQQSSVKSRKPDSNVKTPVSGAPTSLPSSLPFFFPNPSLLYSPLGLGGLNPFSLQPGSAYDSLALLNGTLGVSSASSTSAASRAHKSSTSTIAGRATPVTTFSNAYGGGSQSRSGSSRTNTPLPQQQFMLPTDTHLLESLSRVAAANAAASAAASNSKLRDKGQPLKPKDVDSLRSLMAGVPQFSGKTREQEMKEALESFSKTSAEIFARIPQPPSQSQPHDFGKKEERVSSNKRTRDSTPIIEPEHLIKKLRTENEGEKDEPANLSHHVSITIPSQSPVPPPPTPPAPAPTPPAQVMSVEGSLTPAAAPPAFESPPPPPVASPPKPVSPPAAPVVAAPSPPPPAPPSPPPVVEEPAPTRPAEEATPSEPVAVPEPEAVPEKVAEPEALAQPPDPPTREEEEVGPAKKKRTRAKKSPVSTNISDVVERKNLRSSAGRAAAAAAARQRAASMEQHDPNV
uniref:Chromodomain-helicase-DNA-binding protein 6 n=1 Tax=Lygus hesperus TaxID=30085 RepID=A0A0A9YRD7_LYGHE